MVEKPRSGLVTAGGVLVIVAACIALINGWLTLLASITVLFYDTIHYKIEWLTFYQMLLAVGFFALVGFAFGFVAGVQSLRRKQFSFAAVGMSLLMFAGILNFFAVTAPYSTDAGTFWALAFGGSITILSLLGLVFVATKKQEFT